MVGILFRQTSTRTRTRTRTAFSAAALRLGASIISYGPVDLQENTGESTSDTGRVLSRMLDALVVRSAQSDAELPAYAAQSQMAVINAMSASEHPTQALADLTTISQHFGRVEGIRVLYLGEGNNTAVALALALTRFPGTELTLLTAPGFGIPEATVRRANEQAIAAGSRFTVAAAMDARPSDVDVVYTTRWQTTGTTKPRPDWRDSFKPFSGGRRADEGVPRRGLHARPPGAPRRGGDRRRARWTGQHRLCPAENKLHSASAVLRWCLT